MPRRSEGQTNRSQADANIVQTVSELFADGSQIELLADPANRSKTRLLLWDGQSAKIGSTCEHDGQIYHPVALSRTVLEATHLPAGPGEQDDAAKLFAKISTEFSRRLGLAGEDADRCTFYCVSSWFADVLPILPSLWIAGADATLLIKVMRLMACFCLRPLLLGAVARGAWGLVAEYRPTLLLFDAGVSAGVEVALQASHYRGLLSLDAQGAHNFCFSKAVFSQTNAVDSSLVGEGAVQVTLASDHTLPLGLADHELNEVSGQYQPILLTYRLANLHKVQRCKFDVPEFTFPIRAAAAALGACVLGNPGLTARLITLLRWQDEAARAERCMSPHSSLVEVLLGLVPKAMGKNAHQSNSVTAQEVTKNLNTVLRCRGGIRQYSAEEVGWMLKKLCVPKTRSGAGMQILLGDETARHVHSLALSYGVSAIEVSGLECRDCHGEV
jgi:hypothetical protein